MNDQSERCACPNSSGNIEYACNCGHNIIFLCKLCVVPHLAEPRPHLFISLDQARALKDSTFNDKYTSNMLKYMKLKGEIQNYLPNIKSFIQKLQKFRQDIISYIDSHIDQKIAYLRHIEENVISRSEEISKNITISPSQAYDTLNKYETEGLKGVLDEYPLEFIILEEEVKRTINNMIFIGSHGEFNRDIGYVNEIHELHEVIDKLHENKVSLESQLEKAEKYIKRVKQAVPYQEDVSQMNELNSKRFKYSMTSDPFILQKDLTNNKEYIYNLSNKFQDYFDRYSICEMQDFNFLIIGVKEYIKRIQDGRGESKSQSVSYTSETYRFNLSTFEIIQLAPMLVARDSFKMIYYQGLVYTFGGLKCHSDGSERYLAERIGYNDYEWVKLPNRKSHHDIQSCVPIGSRIYLFGCRQLEYFDTVELKFYKLQCSFIESCLFNKVAYDDDFIYILGSEQWVVFNDSMENILSHGQLKDSRIRFVQLKNESILGFSYDNKCITVYQRFGIRHQVMKTITFHS